MLLLRDSPAMMNPHEYRSKMYEIFYTGGPKGDKASITTADRDHDTFSQGKAELEALLAKGVGGPKPGMNLAGAEDLGEAPSLSAGNDTE